MMLHDDSVDWALLTRYLAGECTPDEAAAVQRWLEADPARQAELTELRRLWDRAGALPSGSRLDSMWSELKGRMEGAASETPAERPALRVLPGQVGSHARSVRLAVVVAAAITLAVGVGVLRDAGRTPPAPVVRAPFERTYTTEPGQRAQVTLPDGSRVELGVASELRVRLADGGRRELHLEGEAVFDVTHDERRPFLVYTANAVTEDLGTRFGVREYESDGGVQVVVVEGKVTLRARAAAAASASDSGATLGPNDLGRLDARGRVTVVHGVNPERYLAWTAGRLMFRQATLREVATQLERWYGVQIEISSSALAGRRVTLDMPVEALATVLDAVTVPLGLRYTTTARGVAIHP